MSSSLKTSSSARQQLAIVLDSKNWTSVSDFYLSFCKAIGAPKWFGLNLDAFRDSLRGGICEITPTKIIIEHFEQSRVNNKKYRSFFESVEQICKEEKVEIEFFKE